MDMRPIGIFDSGLGGLTALRTLRRLLPREELVYFGDTGRAPYGGYSEATIARHALQDARFLRTFQPKAILAACGTVCTTSLGVLRQANPDLPLCGVVEPACREALAATRTGQVGLIATEATVRTGAYAAAMAEMDPAVQMLSQACPLLAALVEEGHFRPGDETVERAVRTYLAPLRSAGVDTLILGCTHYPILEPIIAQTMGPEVRLISAGGASARALWDLLRERDLLNPEGKGTTRFFVSGEPENFQRVASAFLGTDPTRQLRRVEIEQY